MKKQSKINIPDAIDAAAPLTMAEFARIVGVGRSTVLKNIRAFVIKPRAGNLFLSDNVPYLLSRYQKEYLKMSNEQRARFNELLSTIQGRRESAAAPEPPAAPVRPYDIKKIEYGVSYLVGVFEDESFCPLAQIHVLEKGEGVEITPLETNLIFQITGKGGQLENIFPDGEDAPALDLFFQETDDN